MNEREVTVKCEDDEVRIHRHCSNDVGERLKALHGVDLAQVDDFGRYVEHFARKRWGDGALSVQDDIFEWVKP